MVDDGYVLLRRYRGCLMGLSALLILYFHEWIPVVKVPVLKQLETLGKIVGFVGVDCFLFVSGFGLMYAIRGRSLRKFYASRFRRIALPFLFIGVLRMLSDGWTIKQFLQNVSGYSFYAYNIYSLLWFTPAIATLYLLFPVYHKAFSAAGNKTVFTFCFLGVWLAASILLDGVMRPDLYGFTNRIPIFCIGCLTGYRSQVSRFTLTSKVRGLLFAMLCTGVVLNYLTSCCGMPLLVPHPNNCIPNILISLSAAFLVPYGLEWLGQQKSWGGVGAALTRMLSFFGTFSYELYCIQEWLAAQIIPPLCRRLEPLLVNIIVFFAVTACGYILYRIQWLFWSGADGLLLRRKKE